MHPLGAPAPTSFSPHICCDVHAFSQYAIRPLVFFTSIPPEKPILGCKLVATTGTKTHIGTILVHVVFKEGREGRNRKFRGVLLVLVRPGQDSNLPIQPESQGPDYKASRACL